MSRFFVVCDHATIEVQAETPKAAQAMCRCRGCKLVDLKENNTITYFYKDVRVYAADVDLLEQA